MPSDNPTHQAFFMASTSSYPNLSNQYVYSISIT